MGRKKDVGGFHTPFAKLAELKPPAPAQPVARLKLPPAAKIEPVANQTDEAMFLREVLGTTPLSALKPSKKPGERVAPSVTPRQARRSDDAEVMATLADLCEGEGSFDLVDGDEYIEGTAPGVDRRLLTQLRAGDYTVQDHLDLHGMSREAARASVARFVADSRKAGKRCVLIVHGRGLHSKDQVPVLKEAVKSWLERGLVARGVLAFTTARPYDGGAGAVYVLLRK